MAPRRRPQYTQENIDQQLQQIHLLDPSSSSENLEQLGPLIKQIHASRQQDAFLRTVQGLVEAKDAEIEKICGDNYQDFISSVSTLFTVKSYTDKMKQNITSLDASVSQLGRGLVEKKRALLQSKKTAANLDEGIDTLQACLRVLDVVNRVGEMVGEGKYWSALRSLEDIQSMPPTSVSQTPFFQHLLSSLPSLRGQIKDAVTASMKQWLLEIRNVSTEVGRLALEAMDVRARRWRNRREKDPLLRLSRVGSAVEVVTYEKTEFDVLDNEKLRVDFRPLYECIHIYTTLDSLDELQRSYQADRKAQSALILPSPLPLSSLPALTQEIAGFFIVESRVLATTGDFRSERDVEELWDSLMKGLTTGIKYSLHTETDPDVFLKVKECLISFIMTLEAASYPTTSLHAFIIVMFEKYAKLLETQFSRRFEDIVRLDDHVPMKVSTDVEVKTVLDLVWIDEHQKEKIRTSPLPLDLPWSQTFYLCCQDIRTFIQNFYAFIEGVSQHHRNIDELLNKSLDNLLIKHISEPIAQRLASTAIFSQLTQIMTNLEYFQFVCKELGRSLSTLRSVSRGGPIKLTASQSFDATMSRTLTRVGDLIRSKLDQSFELAEYEWTPQTREDAPSMYLYELVNWLTTVVDSLDVKEALKDDAYKIALSYIADCLIDFITGRDIPMMNENAVSNILVDVDFLEEELKRIGRGHLASVFVELRTTASIPLSGTVHEYLVPAMRTTSYMSVRPKRLQAILEKLAKYGATQRDPASREMAEKRRRDAEAVGRIYPGESR
ncbi:exocyst complex component, sec15 subunit [Pluteus cervinus]|uniref:Exocyst complex component, sec15 subunit n=1 Tax=Pluteus cervinus TaxID=181527 RepID=A0ACD3B126_9AGAR|nr:exocyst complex component, sec15 subunit [Pluteus cervinus]